MLEFSSQLHPRAFPEPSQGNLESGTFALTTKNTHTPQKLKFCEITPYYQLIRFLLNYAKVLPYNKVNPSRRWFRIRLADGIVRKSSTTHSTLSVTYGDLTQKSNHPLAHSWPVVTLEVKSRKSNRQWIVWWIVRANTITWMMPAIDERDSWTCWKPVLATPATLHGHTQ